MHVGASNLITDLAYLAGLVVVVAVSYGYFRANVAKASEEVLRRNNEDLLQRVKVLEDNNTALQKQLQEQQLRHASEIAALRSELATIKDLPLGQLLANQQTGIDLLNALVSRDKVTTRTKAR